MFTLIRRQLTVSLILPIFFLSGCALARTRMTDNLSLNACVCNPVCRDILVLGHRGAGCTDLFLPENTLLSFEEAWRMGADGIEIDVRDTKDGIPVIMHDRTVDRTTNGRGHVDQMTLAEVRALKIYSWGFWVPAQTVPTLRETLALMKGKALLDLDLKNTNIRQVVKIIEEESMLEAAYLLIDSVEEGLLARKANAKVALMPKVRNIEEVKRFLDELGPICVFEIDYEDASAELIQFIHSRGIKVHIDALGYFDYFAPYGYRKLIATGADILLTDRLNALVPFIHEIKENKTAN